MSLSVCCSSDATLLKPIREFSGPGRTRSGGGHNQSRGSDKLRKKKQKNKKTKKKTKKTKKQKKQKKKKRKKEKRKKGKKKTKTTPHPCGTECFNTLDAQPPDAVTHPHALGNGRQQQRGNVRLWFLTGRNGERGQESVRRKAEKRSRAAYRRIGTSPLRPNKEPAAHLSDL